MEAGVRNRLKGTRHPAKVLADATPLSTDSRGHDLQPEWHAWIAGIGEVSGTGEHDRGDSREGKIPEVLELEVKRRPLSLARP